MTKIIVVEDHKILREGIVSVLMTEPEFEVAGEAINGKELLELLKSSSDIDIVLMDLNMPEIDGFEAAKIIKDTMPHIKVITLSMYDTPPIATKAMEAGSRGYLIKDIGKEELIYAVKTVQSGKCYISGGLVSILLEERSAVPDMNSQVIKLPLSNRESEILHLISDGLSNKEISEKLFISKRTVETHRMNLLEKTNCKNCAQLIKYGMEVGILS